MPPKKKSKSPAPSPAPTASPAWIQALAQKKNVNFKKHNLPIKHLALFDELGEIQRQKKVFRKNLTPVEIYKIRKIEIDSINLDIANMYQDRLISYMSIGYKHKDAHSKAIKHVTKYRDEEMKMLDEIYPPYDYLKYSSSVI